MWVVAAADDDVDYCSSIGVGLLLLPPLSDENDGADHHEDCYDGSKAVAGDDSMLPQLLPAAALTVADAPYWPYFIHT